MKENVAYFHFKKEIELGRILVLDDTHDYTLESTFADIDNNYNSVKATFGFLNTEVFGEAGLSGSMSVNIGEGGTTDGKLGIGETPTLEINIEADASANLFVKESTVGGVLLPSLTTFIQYYFSLFDCSNAKLQSSAISIS